MFDKIKKFLQSNKTVQDKNLQSLDSDSFRDVRRSNKGAEVITMTMSMHIKAMAERFPEWNGLFEVCPDDDGNVCITCLKGFGDNITMQAIPYLYQRKKFIENCVLFGVEKLIFVDPTNQTFDMIDISEENPNDYP